MPRPRISTASCSRTLITPETEGCEPSLSFNLCPGLRLRQTSYAELIQNRAFQAGTLEAWTPIGGASLALDTSSPLSAALPSSIKVTSNNAGTVGIKNSGWWGIDVKASNRYKGSFYSRGAYSGNFNASLVSDITQEVLAYATLSSQSTAGAWTQHTFELVPTKDAANSNNSFVLQYQAAAETVLNFNLVSLFPPTYNNR